MKTIPTAKEVRELRKNFDRLYIEIMDQLYYSLEQNHSKCLVNFFQEENIDYYVRYLKDLGYEVIVFKSYLEISW